MVQDMDRYTKRERTQNWSAEEKLFLLDLVRRDMAIIENKRLDADLTNLKNRAWKIIHREFSKTYGTERNCNRLKEQWRRMKASTRSEIVDYNHRVTNFGHEVADLKRPSPFTMQVWQFMQDSKVACSKEPLEKDFAKVKLSLEDMVPDGFVFESDDEASSSWTNGEVKSEFRQLDDSQSSGMTPPAAKRSFSQAFDDSTYLPVNATDESDDQSVAAANDVSSTIDALNLLKSGLFASAMANGVGATNGGSGSGSNLSFSAQQGILEMQNKEHQVRMEVLQLQLDTAKFNREAAEINKMIALRNLSVLAMAQNNEIERMNGTNGNGH